ncbi:hypothetical protein [Propionispira raffinosivorans]|uniref:hypothetical protein n=1 Tax=Propionispira raffinosivorans TaxID=86959 RepID=UPI000369E825|nr:hypothetical protein [Propionispira raffinosivorans]
MRKLAIKETAWLKIFHLLFVAAWIGGQMSLALLQITKYKLALPEHTYGILASINTIDDYVVIGGAVGCLLTGLVYSLMTPWGFFKFRWITVKWICTVTLILFGTFFLGPWLSEMAQISVKEHAVALMNPNYLYAEKMHMTWGMIPIVINIFLVIISVLKPWKRLKSQKAIN